MAVRSIRIAWNPKTPSILPREPGWFSVPYWTFLTPNTSIIAHTSFSKKRVSHIGVSLPNESKDSVASTQEKHFDNLSKQSALLAAWTLEAEAKREVRAYFVGPSCGVSFRVSRTLGCFRIRVNDPEHVGITMPFQHQIFFPGFPVDVVFIDWYQFTPFPLCLCPKRLIRLMTLIIITVNEDQVEVDYSPDATRPELVSDVYGQTSTKARRSNKEWKAPIDSHVKRALKTCLGFTVHEWSSCNFFIAF